ncbi:GNAT family N-acetyltransferase [Candidatus Aenigmatarchaeota archaeon]
MEIRAAVEDDFNAILELIKQLTSKPEKYNDASPYREAFLTALKKEGTHVFVLIEDDKVIGHINLSLYWDTWHLGNAVFVDALIIDKNHRGKGHGTKLITFTEKFAKENNAKMIYLYTEDFRKVAKSIYEKAGFKEYDKIFYFKKVE